MRLCIQFTYKPKIKTVFFMCMCVHAWMCVRACVHVRLPVLNSPFSINADIFKCLLSGSTRLISSSLAYAITENTHQSV